ncbi:hypothetical protein [Fontimonas thermophila]|nr:hypothetical protein [Fontimonas thermophila]
MMFIDRHERPAGILRLTAIAAVLASASLPAFAQNPPQTPSANPAASDQAIVDALFAEPAEPEPIPVDPLRKDAAEEGRDDVVGPAKRPQAA